MMTFPTEWNIIKFHGSSHHQPVLVYQRLNILLSKNGVDCGSIRSIMGRRTPCDNFFSQTMCVGTSLQKLIFEVYVCLKECSSKENYHQKARLSEIFRNVQHINFQQVAVAV